MLHRRAVIGAGRGDSARYSAPSMSWPILGNLHQLHLPVAAAVEHNISPAELRKMSNRGRGIPPPHGLLNGHELQRNRLRAADDVRLNHSGAGREE